MSEILSVRTYSPKSSDVFFFDNNIWMFLFCPIANSRRDAQKLYSSFFESVLSARSTIFINSLVLSEFSNACLKLDFKNWLREEKRVDANYKADYIPTDRYKETASIVCSQIKKILSLAEKNTDNFNRLDINSICDNMKNIDFNDSYYIEFCRENNYKLVTDDKDFFKVDTNLTILTIK